MNMKEIVDKLYRENNLSRQEWTSLINNYRDVDMEYLFGLARKVQQRHYGKKVFVRGLIEVSNYCKNDCYYCGIRRSNDKAERYRLSMDDILECCGNGYKLGFRTFVLQGGEDGYHTDEWLVKLIQSIRREYKNCAITLSLGERSHQSYEKMYQAGANRYLLRHETADEEHYSLIHPRELSGRHRKQCLYSLKGMGYQTGTGFMVGIKGQTTIQLIRDLLFIKELQPHMVGIGPFVPHRDTPFAKEAQGRLDLTIFFIGLLRLMLPRVLLPSTTALGTIDEKGREKGILAGANVVMPNLTPVRLRGKYELYNNKLGLGAESAEGIAHLKRRVEEIGYELSFQRGDHPEFDKE